MKQAMQPISVVIPTLDEAENLPQLFERIDMSLSSADMIYEIIVVDDYSTDQTANIVRTADAKYNARLLMKRGKPGKAFSLLEGFAAAKYELVCMIDADLQYPPEAIKHMYHKLQYCEADIVVTERVANDTSLLRRVFSAGFNLTFTRLLFGIKYDTQSGLKLFRKSVLETVAVNPSPWTFDLEFIVKALEQNYVVVSQEIEFSRRHAGTPKIHLLSATWEVAMGSLRLRRNITLSHVRRSYKYSQLLQRTSHIAIAALITLSVVFGLGPAGGSSQALSLPDILPWSSSGSDDRDKNNDETKPSANQQPAAETNSNNTPVTSNAAVVPTATSSAATTSATTTARTSSSAATNNNSNAASTKAQPTANPETLQGSEGKKARYYPDSKLSSGKTESLNRLAVIVVAAGAGLIITSALVIGLRSLIMRIRRPVRI